MTTKQAERLSKELRTYLTAARDAAIRAKGKAEVTSNCDADTDEAKKGLTLLCGNLSAIIKAADEGMATLPSIEACLSAKK